jgi:hypothetical protein
MAITTAICSSFKTEVLTAAHNFTNGQHVFRWALYTSSATLGASTTAYSATNEISGTGYTAKGTTTANVTPALSGTTAVLDWPDPTWTTATFTANGVLLFNDTHASDAAVAVWAFGSDKSASGGDFVLQLPTADASNAILRLA